MFSTWAWHFFLSLWEKGGQGIRTFSEEEGPLEGEGSPDSEKSFFLSYSSLEGDLGGW